ncbi:MAG: hypoxanthine phosphoribosyltransferase [Bacteroidales bacterium]|nr:hypoxanthine phosphoribosyltransferase [Bacteroidales bacterium]
MNRIKLHDKYFVPYISKDEIMKAIDRVAEHLNNDFMDSTEIPIILCTMNGAIVFAGELLTKLKFNLIVSGIKVSSYEGINSSGNIKEVLGLNTDVEGRTVIIVEDIVDTGATIMKLCENLCNRKAKEVRICTLFVKSEVYSHDRKLDYVGMEVADKFIVGHGLDYDELGRNLPGIYILDEQNTQ